MKTKEEILNMNKIELDGYKWSPDLNINNETAKNNSDCFRCSDCYSCYDCSRCSNLTNGLYCRNLRLKKLDEHKYFICNVEVTKEEYAKKLKEIK